MLRSLLELCDESLTMIRCRSEDLTRIVETLVNVGLKDGMGSFSTVQLLKDREQSNQMSASSQKSERTQDPLKVTSTCSPNDTD